MFQRCLCNNAALMPNRFAVASTSIGNHRSISRFATHELDYYGILVRYVFTIFTNHSTQLHLVIPIVIASCYIMTIDCKKLVLLILNLDVLSLRDVASIERIASCPIFLR